MKILFTSDIHGLMSAITDFTKLLKTDDFDVGVISGDILDDGIPDNEMEDMFLSNQLDPDDFIEELPDADDSWEESMEKAIKRLHSPENPIFKALKLREDKIKTILSEADKPVFLIGGNHDLTDWTDYKKIINIHNRKLKLGKYNFVGYKWTKLHRREEDHKIDILKLKILVNRKTILVTHEPAFGILDGSDSNDQIHLGSEYLLKMIKRKKPILHLFGHTHKQFGIEGKSVNGAYPEIRKFVSIDTETNKIEFIDPAGLYPYREK